VEFLTTQIEKVQSVGREKSTVRAGQFITLSDSGSSKSKYEDIENREL